MKVLLDTHVFVWAIAYPERLSPRAKKVIENSQNEVLLSVASVWEMTIKLSLGKLTIPAPAIPFVQKQLVAQRIGMLAIQLSHLERLEKLPLYHRDPFDRLLVAQCVEEDASLITVDDKLQLYPVKVIS